MARGYIKGWAKARRSAIERARGLCEICHIDIAASGYCIEVNHKIALIDGGHPTDPDNLDVRCPPCHKPHSTEVVKRNAKIKRVQAKHLGVFKKRSSRKIQSRPMAKAYRPVNWKNRNKPVSQRGKMR